MAAKKKATKRKATKKKVKKKAAKKKNGKQGEGGGRPKFEIDYKDVEKLAAIQCTQEEIASYLGCSVDTLQRDEKFCGLYKTGMDKGRMSLRRKQWDALAKGNNTMLIWLGKQYLRQADKQHQEVTGPDGGPQEYVELSKKDYKKAREEMLKKDDC